MLNYFPRQRGIMNTLKHDLRKRIPLHFVSFNARIKCRALSLPAQSGQGPDVRITKNLNWGGPIVKFK